MEKLKKNRIINYLDSESTESPLMFQKFNLLKYSNKKYPSRKVVFVEKFNTDTYPAQTLYKPISMQMKYELFEKK
jgi:hypothetical protein